MTATIVPPTKRTPSIYQQAIYDFAAAPLGPNFPYASGNAVINANAGSGKTSVLIGILNLLTPEQLRNSLVCSFSKEIANELERRIPAGANSSTINSAAYKTLRAYVQPLGKWEADTRKYGRLVKIWFADYIDATNLQITAEALKEEVANIASLIGNVFVTLTDYRDAIAMKALAIRFEVVPLDFDRALKCIEKCIDWGWNGLPTPVKGKTYSIRETFDFSEQVYYCATLPVQPWQYSGFILVDEAQDLSPAQLKFVLKLQRVDTRYDGRYSGRFIFVGDRNQAIFSFAGANAQSFDAIKAATNAVEFPLPVCYRCPKSHIEAVQHLVPEIQAAPNALTGAYGALCEDELLDHLRRKIEQFPGAPVMVMCRVTAPLISWCYQCIANGIKAKVRGKSIGDKLDETIDKIAAMEGYKFGEFVKWSGEWLARQIHNLKQASDNWEMAAENLMDKVDALIAIHDYVTTNRVVTDAQALKQAIASLFSDNSDCDVMFTTIHKAKGLEAIVTCLIRPDKLPHPMARTQEAYEQELNLEYVAGTRSKGIYHKVYRDRSEIPFAAPAPVQTSQVDSFKHFDLETGHPLDDDGLPLDLFPSFN